MSATTTARQSPPRALAVGGPATSSVVDIAAKRVGRGRAIDVAAATEAEKAIEKAAKLEEAKLRLREFASANAAKNAASREEDKAKELLNVAMKAAGVQTVDQLVGNRTYVAVIGPVTKDSIDVSKLRTKVTDEVFMKIVSATKGNVSTHAGKSILLDVTTTTIVPEELKITNS